MSASISSALSTASVAAANFSSNAARTPQPQRQPEQQPRQQYRLHLATLRGAAGLPALQSGTRDSANRHSVESVGKRNRQLSWNHQRRKLAGRAWPLLAAYFAAKMGLHSKPKLQPGVGKQV
jgi:hypothetical protein